MPIEIVAAEAALENSKASDRARWPQRREGLTNRIEPIASPTFTPSFRFAPGDTVFTMGSCFARHVEAELERRGFHVPTRSVWSTDPTAAASGNFDNWMLDTYGVPAIYNEIAWAFGETPFSPRDHVFELRPGLYADAHLSKRIPLQPLETVLARRERLFNVTRCLLRADVLVVTLGLAEVWKDKSSGTYLNSRPHHSMIVGEPQRFELHVLSYEEICEFLQRTFDLIFRRCRPDLKVLLTVSPVPITATYTADDVAVANTYSKAVLRAAAGWVVSQYMQMDYYPSYESVTLSDRSLAWEDDQVHVRPQLVEHNVSRMLEAYAGLVRERASDTPDRALPSGEENRLLAEAQDFLRRRLYDEAIGAADLILEGLNRAQALRVQSTAYLRKGELLQAEHLARAAIALRYQQGGLHGLLGEILIEQGRASEAGQSLSIALSFLPGAPRWSALMERVRQTGTVAVVRE